MHQLPRVAPVTASPARAPQTNPTRSNNPRDTPTHSRHNSESTAPGDQGIYMTEAGNTGNSSRETSPEGKLDLIVQNYFYKAALMILDARTNLSQAYTARDNKARVNRWFNTELPETDELLECTRQWKHASALRNRPPNMIIETYIDLRDLASNQKLVIMDEYGKRQDVEVALREHLGGYISNDSQLRKVNIPLERWTCQLGDPWPELNENYPLNEVLPKVYKGSIVLYRSLFAQLKFMPAWKLHKRASKPHPGHVVPRLRWRIYDASQRRPSAELDMLELPLILGSERVTESTQWDPVDSPAGQFSIKVTYRSNCDFRVDTSESLFNSQFMASDEQWFQPSLPRSSVLDANKSSVKHRPADFGSVEARDVPARRKLNEIAEKGPAYGSLSTFHNANGKIGTSPLSALRAARELNAQSPIEGPSQNPLEARPMSRSNSRRSHEASTSMARRPSITIQPFKTPAFSSSVPVDSAAPPSPRVASYNRNSPLATLIEARNPNVSAQTPISPRTSPKLAEALPVGSATGSPRPTPSRFSSSFSHRKNRSSLGGASSSRTEEDTVSSGRGSTSSSNVQTGANAEGNGAAFSQTDDDNISEFLKMLDSKKELKSFKNTPTTNPGTSAARGTTAALTKFQQLRESHTALSDSLSSSQMLQRSSVSSASRQLANVPPMVAGTSTSIASSPSERISPRTPHTPAIPSRLSSNSIIEYNQTERGQRPRPHRFTEGDDANVDGIDDGESRPTTAGGRDDPAQFAGAIPIPTSPRAYQPNYRRSSSAAANQQGRRNEDYHMAQDLGDILPFALRSASMGDGDEREPLSLSGIVRLQDAEVPIPTGVNPPPPDLGSQDLVGVAGLPTRQQTANQSEQARRSSGAALGGEPISRTSSSQGITGRGPRSLVRHSFSRPANLTNFEDDEPLLFAMSEQLESGPSGEGSRDDLQGTGSGAANARGGRMQRRW